MSRRLCEFYNLAPQLVVPDVRKAAEYYRDKFGFEIDGFFFDEPPVYSIVHRDGATIHFGRSDNGETKNNEMVRKGSRLDVYILISDVVALYDELKERGANIVEGPIERVYGRTEITVVDENGFHLVFGE